MSLEFRHIAHGYGEVQALRDISFVAPTGEITCLLGSSGCGKSTLLNLAAGLLDVQEGSIWLDGELLAQRGSVPPPEKRPVGLVFQEGALFPHMTIAQNVAFGLKREGKGAAEGWLEQVGLVGLGARYPHELSGGQQQRAALARAIAPGPRVMLMDEPFASVDIVLRRRLRRDCRVLLRERGATSVVVTHDPEEAIDIADRVAVMESGRIVQIGTPTQLREDPASASIGAIFGNAQVVRARRMEAGFATAFGEWPLSVVAGPVPEGDTLELLVDAERLECVASPEGSTVRDLHSRGRRTRVLLRAPDGTEIIALVSEGPEPGARYKAVPMAGSVRAFAAE
ncbi:MAG: ABC transporter ATP-binding protein [Erythrobacter sp.]